MKINNQKIEMETVTYNVYYMEMWADGDNWTENSRQFLKRVSLLMPVNGPTNTSTILQVLADNELLARDMYTSTGKADRRKVYIEEDWNGNLEIGYKKGYEPMFLVELATSSSPCELR